jgi:hypothetical protein
VRVQYFSQMSSTIVLDCNFNLRFRLRIRISNIAFDCNRFHFLLICSLLRSLSLIRFTVWLSGNDDSLVSCLNLDGEFDCELDFELQL